MKTEAEMQQERERIARQRNATLKPSNATARAANSKAGKAATATSGRKQASLMSFFKK